MSIDELTAKLDASDAKIAELTALNAEFEKENISLTAKITELEKVGGEQNEKIAKLESDATAASEAHSVELAKLNTDLEAANTALSESKKETAILREQSARFGAAAPRNGKQGEQKKELELSRADFNALPVGDRFKFIADGGKLI